MNYLELKADRKNIWQSNGLNQDAYSNAVGQAMQEYAELFHKEMAKYYELQLTDLIKGHEDPHLWKIKKIISLIKICYESPVYEALVNKSDKDYDAVNTMLAELTRFVIKAREIIEKSKS